MAQTDMTTGEFVASGCDLTGTLPGICLEGVRHHEKFQSG